MNTTDFRSMLENIIFQEVELSVIRDYYHEMEKYNYSAQEKHKEYLRNAKKYTLEGLGQEADSYADHYMDIFNENLDYYVNGHLQLLRRTTFVEIYFLFEDFMNKKCKLHKELNNSNLSLRDINGQGIERAKIYLTKVCNITEPFKTKEWSNIIEYGKARNAIVHNRSIVVKKKDYGVKNLPGLKVVKIRDDNSFPFILEEDFVPICLNTINKFVENFK
ncbi:hypothetical protein MH206_01695 [Bacillus altitudinis]|uniref:hypothetical protein n=1 Tax=Bacillus altitudinis TaxID=293387 RepID=UPI002280F571|nr:hypothetical protein [Bacillus altitudinis]MCY7627752.1 hypothetical protein [Bacillus altitudinis]MDX2363632.1 hypothetical protein [Bacillus altitudinis]